MPSKKMLTATEVLSLRYPVESQLSPNGRYIAAIITVLNNNSNEYEQHLNLVPTNGDPVRQLTFTHTTIRQPHWTPDSRAIVFVSKGPSATPTLTTQIWQLALDGGEPSCLTTAPAGAHSPAWSPDGHNLLYIAAEAAEAAEQTLSDQGGVIVVDRFVKMHQLWCLDLDSGKCRQLTRDRSSKAAASWSPDGQHIVFEQRPDPTHNYEYASSIYTVDANGKNKKKISSTTGSDTCPRFSPDSNSIAFLHRCRAMYSFPNLIALTSATGGSIHLLTETLDRDAVHLTWHPNGKGLYCHILDGVRSTIYYCLSSGTNRPLIQGDRILSSLSLSANGRIMAFISITPNNPGEIHLAQSNGKQERVLSQFNPLLAKRALATTQIIHWSSFDGTILEGLLVLPPKHKKGKPIPLIVEPHGGPASRHTCLFAATRQVLAANNYAIFAPNFRGSAAYGSEFVAANSNDFGGGDFKDIMAGLDMLITTGVAAAQHLAIMGSSYGGFMTAWTIGHTNRFKAAVDGAGVHNLLSFFGTTDIQWFTHYYQCGYPWEKQQNYLDQSPITYAHHIKTPTLIYHGEADRRVPIEQSEQLYMALKHQRIPVEFIRYPRAGHSLTEYWHKLDLIERTVQWFDLYVKGKNTKNARRSSMEQNI